MRRTHILALLLAAALPSLQAKADAILHSFEADTEGWENETASPVLAYRDTNMVHHGQASLAFNFHFAKTNAILHVRCKEGYPKDFSGSPTFRGFSAWVYISRGDTSLKIENFEVQMFVRSGEAWQWTTGDANSEIGLGWIKIDIRRDQIFDVSKIQDIGIQVRNRINDLKTTVYVDQVEALGVAALP